MKQTLIRQIAKAMSVAVLAATLTMTGLNATAPPARAFPLFFCMQLCFDSTSDSTSYFKCLQHCELFSF